MQILKHHFAKTKPIVGSIVNTLFPARCAACSELTESHGSLCATCWQNIHFIADPICCKCGLPFEYNIGEKAVCGRCMEHKPAYTEARAIFKYDENSRSQVLALKYHDKTQLAPIFGRWLARIAGTYKDKAQFIMPVPLHPMRIVTRRYNQAALLSYALSEHIGLPVLHNTLLRTRMTPTQSGLTRRQRADNMRGAFRVPEKKREVIKGNSVILIDDVMTTGATLEACARALHDAGVQDVYVLTLARTVLAD